MKHTPRKTVGLSNSVHQRLNMYALAASAAGIGILSPQAAECKIVYTPTHVTIGPNQIYSIDLQHNKVIDFRIFNDCRTVSGYRSAVLLVDAVSPSTNALKGTPTSNGGNSAFRPALAGGLVSARIVHFEIFQNFLAPFAVGLRGQLPNRSVLIKPASACGPVKLAIGCTNDSAKQSSSVVAIAKGVQHLILGSGQGAGTPNKQNCCER
jgi:hypothetical protein